MASLNKVYLMGNLTRDPELRYIPSGAAVTTFGMAVNRIYNTQSGEQRKETCFIKIVVWGKMAEVSGEYLSKGSPLFVEGRLQSRSWVGQDGQKRSTIEVVANNIQFLRPRNSQGAPPGEMPGAEAPPGRETPSYENIDQGIKTDTVDKAVKETNRQEEAPF